MHRIIRVLWETVPRDGARERVAHLGVDSRVRKKKDEGFMGDKHRARTSHT